MWNRKQIVKHSRLTLFNKKAPPVLRNVVCSSFVLLGMTACSLGSSDSVDSGPVIASDPVAFIKRPLLFDEDNESELLSDDLRIPQSFRPGARLYIKNSASPNASAKDITSSLFSSSRYDVRDLNGSPDGTKLVFAVRAPALDGVDDAFQPKWNLWVYDRNEDRVQKLMSDATAEAGHDISPAFLPDGRIVFASTRQQTSKAILLDEGKPQYAATEEDRLDDLDDNRNVEAFSLHVVNADGTDIEQITFNQSHDLNPVVLSNGKILFSRLDNAGQTSDNGFNLYQVNPDGTGLTYLYGRHSHDTGSDEETVQFVRPLEDERGDVVVQLRPMEAQIYSGLPTRIFWEDHVEHDLTLGGLSGDGQSSVISGINTSGEPDLDGAYGSLFPLYDGTGRYLVSWSICRIREAVAEDQVNNNPVEVCTQEKIDSGDYESAPPAYGLWILDGDTQRPIELPEEGQMYSEAVVMNARAEPDYIAPATLDTDAQALADDGYGVVHIRSVYDLDGVDTSPLGLTAVSDPQQTAPTDRPARFLRVEKPVSIPSEFVYDFENSAFGRSNAQSMREILGYVPIEPDGSVKFAVPANVAFAVSVLDEQGRRTSERHQNWLSVRPGETMECKGCHTAASEVPHGRRNAGPASINDGATVNGVPFPNTEPALFADLGETMAEVYARINGVRAVTPDIVFDDDWTDPLVTPKAASFTYAYADLNSNSPIPSDSPCLTNWTSICRITVNYPEHIHPLWQVDRRVFDVDEVTVLADNTCITCHDDVDDMDTAMVPEQQLDLSDGISDINNDHFKSYHELLSRDNEQELVGGVLTDRLVPTGEFLRDDSGNLILDGSGNPIPEDPVPVAVQPTMRVNGALSSPSFMNLFLAGGAHDGYLSDAEIKLISEWLDLGAQYWNNPFLAPEN